MSFLWGEALWLVALLPLLALVYAWLLNRRRKWALRWSNLALVKGAIHPVSWKRHVPSAMLLAGVTAMILAVARPTAVLTLPAQQQAVILAMDVSVSMQAEDAPPDRLTAAQEAAKAFVAELPRDVRVGVVSYGGTAHVVQAPTRSRESVISAIDSFQIQSGTAIGNGLVVALSTIFPKAGITVERAARLHGDPRGPAHDEADSTEVDEPSPVAAGSYKSAVIVLLSDGQNTTGVNPMTAAKLAANRGVKVFTVGFGTKQGEIVKFGGWAIRVRLDEETLNRIASLTHGEYFYAANGTELQRVYQAMSSRFALERGETEVTGLFAMLAATLVAVGTGLSVWWHARLF